MKNIVRALVLVLTLTGAAASTQITTASVKNGAAMGKMSSMPKPTCPINDPTGCGM